MAAVNWLPSICRNGPWQMACDEALLDATAADGIPRFRFYTWSAPTISLGYFQDYQKFRATFPDLSDLTIVRRLTGGGAILHDREITYCLTMPADSPFYQGGAMAAYILVHQAIADALKKIGVSLFLRPKQADYMKIKDEPEFCFARPCPTDLICSAGKLVGSAQRRLPKAFLQHGSIMLDSRFSAQPVATLAGLIHQSPGPEVLEQMIVDELTGRMESDFVHREFTSDEEAASEKLVSKYIGDDWTIHRRTPGK